MPLLVFRCHHLFSYDYQIKAWKLSEGLESNKLPVTSFVSCSNSNMMLRRGASQNVYSLRLALSCSIRYGYNGSNLDYGRNIVALIVAPSRCRLLLNDLIAIDFNRNFTTLARTKRFAFPIVSAFHRTIMVIVAKSVCWAISSKA